MGQVKYVQRLGRGSVIADGQQVITINAVMYISSPNLAQGTWIKACTVPQYYRPANTVYWTLPMRIPGPSFYDAAGVIQMAGESLYTEAQARLLPNGDLEVYLVVSTWASVSGTSVAIIPLHVTYFYFNPL
jgi:hypothetical protein